MTEMNAHTTHQQPPVHVFYKGLLLDTPPCFDDWSAIEDDIALVTWEALLILFPNEDMRLSKVFSWF
jgi:hypothetical protein